MAGRSIVGEEMEFLSEGMVVEAMEMEKKRRIEGVFGLKTLEE